MDENNNNNLQKDENNLENNENNTEETTAQYSYEPQENPPQPENRAPQKRASAVLAALLVLIFAVITTLTVYFMYTDIASGSNATNERQSMFSLLLKSKPQSPSDSTYMDEDGRYTTEGIAKLIQPKIVEVYSYNSKNPGNTVSCGTGIIISRDGYIVTNTHILDGRSNLMLYDLPGEKPDRFMVITHDKKKYDASITGRDAKTDIAVIKINAKGLSCAEFGDSDETLVGEKVAAVGNPEGLVGSVTFGVVSGLNRRIKGNSTSFEMDCIQTDAAISPGNSGGALVNMYGQVIGITASKNTNADAEGLGFAIAINEAKPIIEELVQNGYVSGRVRIGITFISMNSSKSFEEFKQKYNMEIPEKLKGLWITDIDESCDIANTELRPDDFILSVNNMKIHSYSELNEVIKNKKAGDKLKAECARIENGNVSYFNIEFKLIEDTSGDF